MQIAGRMKPQKKLNGILRFFRDPDKLHTKFGIFFLLKSSGLRHFSVSRRLKLSPESSTVNLTRCNQTVCKRLMKQRDRNPGDSHPQRDVLDELTRIRPDDVIDC